MKFTATVLALCSLYSVDAFVAQTPKQGMQPLHATNTYMNRLSNPTTTGPYGVPQFDSNGRTMNRDTVRDTANSPYSNSNYSNSNYSNSRNGRSRNGRSMNGRDMNGRNRNGRSMNERSTNGYERSSYNTAYESPNSRMSTMRENVDLVNGRVVNERYGRDERYGRYDSRMSTMNEEDTLVNGRSMNGYNVRNTGNSNYAPPRYGSSMSSRSSMPITTQQLFDEVTNVEVQGKSLRTCAFDENVERVSVLLKTTGRPLNAKVELWQGPDNSPQTMSVYLEDGDLRPFRATVESPGSANAVAIRNTGAMEFPITAGLECDTSLSATPSEMLLANSKYRTIQGGAVYTTPFPPMVQSVQIALRTDGRPLNARVELLQGPNNNKQVMEVYTEDGDLRPFFAIIDTPGAGNVVRIVNTATVEFPLTAAVEAYMGDSMARDEYDNGGLTWS